MKLVTAPNFPHRDWQEPHMVDLKQAIHTCDYCGKERIRYVFHMKHPNWPAPIQVGKVCAGDLSGADVNQMETEFIAHLNKLDTFVNSPRWKVSKKLNWYRKFEGWLFVVSDDEPYWAIAMAGPTKTDLGTFDSFEDAKIACYHFYDRPSLRPVPK